MKSTDGIIYKTKEEIHLLRKSNRAARRILRRLAEVVRPGVTTGELEKLARRWTREFGGRPAFVGFPGSPGARPFPAAICVAPNEVVVHGIPDGRELREGDIVGIDYGIALNHWYGDTAWTFAVGEVSAEAQHLLRVTEESLYKGIEQATAGNMLGQIAHAIQTHVEKHGCSVVRQLVGHGIGRSMHEPPQVPNFGPPTQGPRLRPGMTLAIEPMINRGSHEVHCLEDGWTVVTADGSLSAHFEHTVVVLSDGPEILSADE